MEPVEREEEGHQMRVGFLQSTEVDGEPRRSNTGNRSWGEMYARLSSHGPLTREEHVNTEAGHEFPIGGRSQPTTHEGNNAVAGGRTISMEDRYRELNCALERSLEQLAQHNVEKTKIQKVPHILADKKALYKYYVPKVYSFGPIHHGNSTLQEGEEIKLTLAALYTRELNKQRLFCKIKDNIQDLRQWYDADVTEKYDDEELSWMFFVDGCALLHFIIDFVEHRFLDNRKPLRSWPKIATADVFMLENQLPYRVLELLIDGNQSNSRDASTTWVDPEKCINKFIVMSSIFMPVGYEEQLVESVAKITDRRHILDVMWKSIQPNTEVIFRPDSGTFYFPVLYRIQELKKVGIKLKLCEPNQLRNVDFRNRCLSGELTLPPLRFAPGLISVLANMMAHEMCLYHLNNTAVTSYVYFLNSLVGDARDVEEMKTAEILYNYLSSDEAVVEVLRELATDINLWPDMFLHVKLAITEYFKAYKGKAKIIGWFVEAGQVYFRTPWTTVAFFAAVLAIALTMTNTIFTILDHHHEK